MKFIESKIQNVYIVEPEPFIDNRGMFARVFDRNEFKEIGYSKEIVNINN